jgi:hypothetical protein
MKRNCAVVGGLGGGHPLSSLEGQLKTYGNEIEKLRTEKIDDGHRGWIADYILRKELEGGIWPLAAAVGRWIEESNTKIAQEREILK